MTAARPCITVLAGTNGAGKSSIAGALILDNGGAYFNPDEAARRLRQKNPALNQQQANGLAWREGVNQLRAAIAQGGEYVFETTLGGNTVARMLEQALNNGIEVRIWYAGLSSAELHLARVAARVKQGGHDIPEADIRRRYDNGLRNLIRLLPKLTELRLFDNSAEADPKAGKTPAPRLLLHWLAGKILAPADLRQTPEWAKPVVAAALKRRKV